MNDLKRNGSRKGLDRLVSIDVPPEDSQEDTLAANVHVASNKYGMEKSLHLGAMPSMAQQFQPSPSAPRLGRLLKAPDAMEPNRSNVNVRKTLSGSSGMATPVHGQAHVFSERDLLLQVIAKVDNLQKMQKEAQASISTQIHQLGKQVRRHGSSDLAPLASPGAGSLAPLPEDSQVDTIAGSANNSSQLKQQQDDDVRSVKFSGENGEDSVFGDCDENGNINDGVISIDYLGMGLDWPATVQPRELAKDSGAKSKGLNNIGLMLARRPSLSKSATSNVDEMLRQMNERMKQDQAKLGKCLIEPHSRGVVWFDCVGCVVLLYDILITPYLVAMDIPMTPLFLTLAWLAGSYWFVDMCLNFCRGFYRHGDLVMSQPKVAIYYLKHWFFFDVLLLTLDLVNTTFSTLDSYPSSEHGERILKSARVMRILKTLRIGRLGRIFSRVASMVKGEEGHVALQIVKVTLATILISHILTCAFLLIGREAWADTGLRWPDVNSVGEYAISDTGYLYRYTSALHWTLAQMTLGANELVPVNSGERLFTTALLIFGLLYGSTLVSFFSAQVLNLVVLRRDQWFNMNKLRTFLRQYGVSTGLAEKITRQVKDRSDVELPLYSDDVPYLTLISSSLSLELARETVLPHVLRHRLFETWENLSSEASNVFCREAVRFLFVAEGDDVFLPLHLSHHAYFLFKGVLQYEQRPDWSKVRETSQEDIPAPHWMCEASLWVNWVHVGKCQAAEQCSLLKVSAEAVEELVKQYSLIGDVTRHYARNFHERLISARPPHSDFPSDVHVPLTEAAELLLPQVDVGLVREALASGRLNDDQGKLLIDELEKDECSLDRSHTGELKRVVTLVVVHVADNCGKTLIQIGKRDQKGKIKANVLYPAIKRQKGELPQAALKRLMNEQLRAFRGKIQVVETNNPPNDIKESEQLGMMTQYTRLEYTLSLTGSMPFMDVAGYLDQHEIYALTWNDGKVGLYSWLTEQQYEYWKRRDNDARLQECVKDAVVGQKSVHL
mmetsp:Transcript_43155/g.101411  ORF Transcript_43155/g.101411 Transcript_43155/m.101411 type:complete len:1008 (-) Transcript_43155:68-3091(-)